MADFLNPARAAIGQGLGMGWGDEAEAWLRSKLGPDDYDQSLAKIRQEYAQYSQDNPLTAGAAEFAGGAIPGVAAMLIPGGQAAGAVHLGRSGAGILARMAALGAGTGAIAGAGSAQEGDRLPGAGSGALIGGSLGVALPLGLRGASAGSQWLRDRLAPTEARVASRAAEKMNQTLARSKTTPADIQTRMAEDAAMGVPSVVANANPKLSRLAKTVARRPGQGASDIEEALFNQRMGTSERTYSQVHKALQPGDYYTDVQDIQRAMSTKAAPLYEKAYQYGEVTDPEVLKFMSLPQFKQAGAEAQKLLAAEGRTVDMSKPTVEVLDQIKRGLDSLIEGQTDAVTGKTTSLGRVYLQKKNDFLNALDAAVPEYAQARATYRGDAEILNAMRRGINDFGRLDHEQVTKLVSGMSAAEKAAFRTGVARDLYSRVMNPSGNFNAAQRIIGAPEMQAKLQPLFDNPGQFELFKAATEREAQLFHQSSKILGGSDTAENLIANRELDDDLVGSAIHGFKGGFQSGLSNLVGTAISSGTISEKVGNKLATMLMSKDPHDVAAVVKLLEEQASKAAPRALRAGITEAGVTTGTASSLWPSPPISVQPASQTDIDTDLQSSPTIESDIEADIAAEAKK